MENFRDFLGKDFDDCIEQAINYYGCGRDSLEIELIQEAKSGIFGIIGARKAKIRARRVHVREKVASLLNAPDSFNSGNAQERKKVKEESGTVVSQQSKTEHGGENGRCARVAPGDRPDGRDKSIAANNRNSKSERPRHQRDTKGKRPEGREKAEPAIDETSVSFSPASGRNSCKKEKEREAPLPAPSQPEPQMESGEMFSAYDGDEGPGDDLESASWPVLPLSELDGDLLRERAIEIMRRILEPIAGRPLQMTMDLGQRSVRIHVEWEGDAGLLIGRDGHTMAAAQYLASRILSRAMKSVVRVQLDIGNYRARQEDKLRELARSLAEKAASLGKPLSTGPLSAYHRRVVHLSLQDNEAVQTRSIGDGPVKRVLISPRRICQP